MNSRPGIAPPAPSRIVVRGVNWLGDAVMSTPALLRLRQAHPQAFIALVTPEKLSDLWREHPALDLVFAFAPNESVGSLARRLRAGKFDLALLFPNSFRSALEFWRARIPRRIGYAGQLRQWLLTDPVRFSPNRVRMRKRSRREIVRLTQAPPSHPLAGTGVPAPHLANSVISPGHHLHLYLHLASQLGADPEPLPPQLFVSEPEVKAALARLQIPCGKPLMALNCGAEYGPAKRWPAERFIAAASAIQERLNCCWLVLGGEADRVLAGDVAAGIQNVAGKQRPADSNPAAINLAGATSLRDLCAVLKACRVLLTNDTGPMHVAAALGTPVVAPFGSTSPELTGPGHPGQPRHQLLKPSALAAPCAPCFLRHCPIDFRCMQSIHASDVVAALVAALQIPHTAGQE